MNESIEKAINDQINMEFNAAYSYLGMSSYFDTINMEGFAHWCQAQYREELNHGMRLFNYLQDRGGKVILTEISAPSSTYDNAKHVFETALKQEQQNTASINELYQKANEAKDHATISHLQWFIDEQVEEEKTISDILALVDMAKNDVTALLYLNDKLASRSVPAPEQAE